MRVLIATPDPTTGLAVASHLQRLGHTVIGPVRDGRSALRLAQTEDPDVYLMDVAIRGFDVLVEAARLDETCCRPVVILADETDETVVERSIAIGACALLATPVDGRELGAVIPLAEAQHRRVRALERQVERAERALDERKTIERAKGLLMSGLQLSEDEAFTRMRRSARDRNLTLVQVTRQVLDQDALLTRRAASR